MHMPLPHACFYILGIIDWAKTINEHCTEIAAIQSKISDLGVIYIYLVGFEVTKSRYEAIIIDHCAIFPIPWM